MSDPKSIKVSRDAVVWAYRLILGREPESEAAIRDHVRGAADFTALRRAFLDSAEFSSLSGQRERQGLDGDEPARTIETSGDPAMLRKLFEHIDQTWQHLGDTDPYWSVLTSAEYRGKPAQEDIDRFFASGKAEVERLFNSFAREGIRPRSGVCVEYGCGLGRVTRYLAEHFERVVGVDISASHLALAEKLATAAHVGGVQWTHLESLESLESLPETDFIYSMIVLQHNPPPVIERIIATFARILKPGGIAHFQVPTYRADYEFRLDDYLKSHAGRREMEMHAFPQRRIFEIFSDAGAIPVMVVEDGSTGFRHGERSNTFTFRKI